MDAPKPVAQATQEKPPKPTAKAPAKPVAKSVAKPAQTPDPRAILRARAEACGKEVEAVCQRHGCRIAAFLTSENVGNDGARAMIGADYGIFVVQTSPDQG